MNTFDPKHRYSDAAKLARLKNKKLFLFDIDGTIAVGDTLYEGSADLIRYINAIGGRAYYITNNSTKSGLDYVKKFHDAFHLDSTCLLYTSIFHRKQRKKLPYRIDQVGRTDSLPITVYLGIRQIQPF